MQNRMKQHQLDENDIIKLLTKTSTGSLATINSDGSPYVLPVHFVYYNKNIYIHGLQKGQKIENIKNNPKVSITIYEMTKLILDPEEKPCDTNTEYQSVVASGLAAIIDSLELKEIVLKEVVSKYTPHLASKPLPQNMVKGTAVIEIQIESITGKFYS